VENGISDHGEHVESASRGVSQRPRLAEQLVVVQSERGPQHSRSLRITSFVCSGRWTRQLLGGQLRLPDTQNVGLSGGRHAWDPPRPVGDAPLHLGLPGTKPLLGLEDARDSPTVVIVGGGAKRGAGNAAQPVHRVAET
jgi:hypothetical protein